jgi:hypothetical protein
MTKELSEFYKNHVSTLSDQKLLEILDLDSNNEISQLAHTEALSRKIIKKNIKIGIKKNSIQKTIELNDIEKLKKWNWGAFILNWIWALGNGLSWWAVLCFIPGLNLFIIFHFGRKGNRLAWEKSKLSSVNESLEIQNYWSKWGIRIFWILIAFGLIGLLFGL